MISKTSKKLEKLLIVAIFCLLLPDTIFTQTQEWTLYSKVEHISSFCEYQNCFWVGTDVGLVKYDETLNNIEYYNKLNSGLPANAVSSLETDGNYLWIATSRGLVRYDGDNWIVRDKTNSSLPYDRITSLTIDKSGYLWIGGQNFLIKCDSTWIVYTPDNSNLPYSTIHFIQSDTKERIWASASGKGLIKVDKDSIFLFNKSNTPTSLDYISSFKIDKTDTLWLGTFSDLIKFDGDSTWKIYGSADIEALDYDIRALSIDNNNKIWIGSNHRLINFDRNKTWNIYDSNDSGGLLTTANSLFIDNYNRLWIGQWLGPLIGFNGSEWYEYGPVSNSGLPRNSIKSIAFDQSGNVWFGTYTGLGKYDFQNWEVFNASNSEIADQQIKTVHIDDNNNVWVGTAYTGLVKYDGVNWTNYNSSNSGIPSYSVRALNHDKNNNLFVGTENGLVMFDGINWKTLNIDSLPGFGNYVYAIAVDTNDVIWFGLSGGLVKYEDNVLTEYTRYNSGIPGPAYALSIDKNNNIWIASSKNLTKYDRSDWYVYELMGQNQNWEINTLIVDLEINVWIGTVNQGIIIFNNDETWSNMTPDNSYLPNSDVLSIAIDKKGNKWIGTDDGLAIYNQGGIVKVEEFEGLKSNFADDFTLFQNYPNPFRKSTMIKYFLNEPNSVNIKIYDIRGREIRSYFKGFQTTGGYIFNLKLHNQPSGIYFLRYQVGEYLKTQKLILQR